MNKSELLQAVNNSNLTAEEKLLIENNLIMVGGEYNHEANILGESIPEELYEVISYDVQAEIEKLQAESGMGNGPMMLKASQVFDLVFTKGSPELKAALITYGIHAGNG